jgi:hypothetical protein
VVTLEFSDLPIWFNSCHDGIVELRRGGGGIRVKLPPIG